MKSIEELVFKDESAIYLIKQWVNSSNNKNKAVILSSEKKNGINELLHLQITTKSTLGAVAYHTGGITVQNGWLRVLGSGHPSLTRTISSWNKCANLKNMLLIADDIIGGFFSLNGGYLPFDIGRIFYLAPDTLKWESLGMLYSDFLHWTITGDLNQFYKPFLWNGWAEDILSANGDKGFSFYPFLWSEESRDIDNCLKKIVPIEEIWKITKDFQKKFISNH